MKPARTIATIVALLALVAPMLAATQPADASTSTTPIMRQPRLTPAQLAGWFHQQSPGGYSAAVPVEFLAAYFIFEGQAEGVSGDIAFAQSILETSWFRFPSYGQVRASDNNFGGIGACDGGTCTVARFRSARVGVRAQIQHLRAYGDATVTESNLAYPLESPRFHLVSPKGRAPLWEDMGGGNWATDPLYSKKILDLYASMVRYARDNPQLTGAWLFSDVAEGSTFEHDIISIAINDITRGCGSGLYCPHQNVTREQMASFLVRALGLRPSDRDAFRDVSLSNPHRRDINALREAGITQGCNPPQNDRFCPGDPVSREQMASFISRSTPYPTSTARFVDVHPSNPHATDISRLAGGGITRGCNPPTNDRFCPSQIVTREQMAAFLRRAFL